MTNLTNLQLIENAKEYLKKQPFGNKLLPLLTNDDLLLLMLLYYKYNTAAICIILGLVPSKATVKYRVVNLKNKMFNAGLSDLEISSLFNEKT